MSSLQLLYIHAMDYYNQESERLRFRKLSEDDIDTWAEFFVNNDRLRFLGMDDTESKEVLSGNWINKQLSRYKDEQGFGHLAVELVATGEFIGMGGILPRNIADRADFEIAYSLLPRFWGKGYATEIAKQMMCFGIDQVKTDRLISMIVPENIDSINVAKKNGMEVLFQTHYYNLLVDVYGVKTLQTEFLD